MTRSPKSNSGSSRKRKRAAAKEFRRLPGNETGEALISAMQASPDRDVSIEPVRAPMLVRKISR